MVTLLQNAGGLLGALLVTMCATSEHKWPKMSTDCLLHKLLCDTSVSALRDRQPVKSDEQGASACPAVRIGPTTGACSRVCCTSSLSTRSGSLLQRSTNRAVLANASMSCTHALISLAYECNRWASEAAPRPPFLPAARPFPPLLLHLTLHRSTDTESRNTNTTEPLFSPDFQVL